MNLGIAGRTAVVTGASQGIGYACAHALASEGVHLALIARNGERLKLVADELTKAYSVRCEAFACDISGPGLTDQLKRVGQVMGVIDIIVNNAGSTASGDLYSDDESVWRSGFELKLLGYLRVIRHFAPLMVQSRWGRIVNVIGRSGVRAEPTYLAGGALNAAVINLTQALAKELGPSQVLVNGINPGPIATERWQRIVAQRQTLTQAAGVQDVQEAVLRKIPVGRVGEPEEVASMVAFLCSEAAAFTNGAIIGIDGGMAV
jgi:3-oxoacyl-[acyl-carrier protein] reductase